MSATQIRNNTLSNTGPKRKGSPLPVIIVLVILGVGGYFGWKEYDKRKKAEAARIAEYYRQLAEKEAREKAEAEAAAKAQASKTNKVVQVVQEKKVEPKKRTAMEIWQAREAIRKDVLAKIAEARKNPEATPLNGFAGIRFGEPLKDGSAVRWGTVMDGDSGDSVSTRGAAFAVYGPKLKKPFMSLGASPLVWVTPQTRRPYRIEFSRPLQLKPGMLHEAETTNLVAVLAKRFKAEPFVPLPIDPEVKGCEYVFPMGSCTVSIAENGDNLVLSVEREDIRAEARTEAEALRKAEKQVDEKDSKALDSKRYPNRAIEMKNYYGVKFNDKTPRSFCGIVFASRPPESAKIIVPMEGPKGFFLDYEMAKCRVFRGFARGRADIDSARGGVYAVTLFSEGGTEGLDDKDYFESVRDALSGHYKVQPVEKKGAGEYPQLTYTIGDLVIDFSSDPRGGFLLRAENKVLAELAKGETKSQSRTGQRKTGRRKSRR